ncbi:MAG: histidine--tRNA ligase [Candidatus Sericytochromatia bacterium]|nr:histidine--tRNA ligase [Candidatus Sericytochromatia bacterium]
MTQPLQTVKGTKDILPHETPRWRFVESRAQDVLARYGYREIRTPIYEATELFARGIGETTDIVGKEMFSFDDRGGRHVTLRPENTAGVVRAYIQHKLYTQPAPQKYWYFGPMFRAENVQAGRQRQFHQLGVECLAAPDPCWDAESIAMAAHFLAELGLKPLDAWQLQVNSVGCDGCRPAYRDALQLFLRSCQADLCPDCRVRTERNPLRVLDCKVPACRSQLHQAPLVDTAWCNDCRQAFAQVEEFLTAAGVPFTHNPRLVRGLDYYSRTVFEFIACGDRLGAQSTLCAGGRYDALVADLGGPASPAVGWALGVERLLLVLGTELPGAQPPVAVLVTPPGTPFSETFRLACSLRSWGLSVEMAPGGKLERQFKLAERLGVPFALVVGEAELAAGEVILKNLTTRSQQRVLISRDALRAALTSSLQEVQ